MPELTKDHKGEIYGYHCERGECRVVPKTTGSKVDDPTFYCKACRRQVTKSFLDESTAQWEKEARRVARDLHKQQDPSEPTSPGFQAGSENTSDMTQPAGADPDGDTDSPAGDIEFE